MTKYEEWKDKYLQVLVWFAYVTGVLIGIWAGVTY